MAWSVAHSRLQARKRQRETSKTRLTRPEIIGAIGGRQRSKDARRSARDFKAAQKRTRRGRSVAPPVRMPATPRVRTAKKSAVSLPVMGTPAGLEKKIRVFLNWINR